MIFLFLLVPKNIPKLNDLSNGFEEIDVS